MEQSIQEPITHEWIENYTEYEAVLVCTNALQGWDKVAVVRAFQTYQWNDGTTLGNDASFSHIGSGVIVLHDGNLLAIVCGHEMLDEALPDLFEVLYALGWRSAVVYHPPETMSALLVDMGRAIPARLNFDIQPAPAGRAISDFAEGATLIERGKQALLAGGMDELNNVVLSELVSMDTAFPDGDSASPQAVSAIVLIDDFADDLNDTIEVGTNITSQATAGNAYFEDEQPPTFVIPVEVDLMASEQSAARPSFSFLQVSKNAQASPPAAVANVVDNMGERVAQSARTQAIDDALVARNAAEAMTVIQTAKANEKERSSAALLEPSVQLKTQPQPPALRADVMGESKQEVAVTAFAPVANTSLNKIVRVGLSAFCFDVPSDPVSDDEIRMVADECRVADQQVVHLYPGAMNELVRWDVLGEIVPEYPWFAEKLAGAMNLQDCAMVAGIILALKNANLVVELRDVLMFACADSKVRVEMLAGVSPTTQVLFMRADARGEIDKTMNEIVQRLGALSLAPAEQAFVDLRSTPNELGADIPEAITVRAVMQSSMARMFIVHVDVLDGPFVSWIVELLRSVAISHGATKRYCKAAQAIVHVDKIEQENAASKAQVAAEVNEAVGSLVAQLRKLGCDV